MRPDCLRGGPVFAVLLVLDLYSLDPWETRLVEFLGSDCFPAYLKYMRDCSVLLQLCLAHLIREVKFLAEHPDPGAKAYGARFVNALKNVFDAIHRRDRMTPRGFTRALKAAKRRVLKAATWRVPTHPDAQTLAKRMRENGEAHFAFVTTPGVEPTNDVPRRHPGASPTVWSAGSGERQLRFTCSACDVHSAA